jgi:hypothetical protein
MSSAITPSEQIVLQLRQLMAEHKLVDPNFYTEDSLKRFFSAKSIVWYSSDSQNLQAGMRALSESQFPAISRAPNTEIYVAFASSANGPHKAKAQLIVPHLDDSVHVLDLIKVLGSDYSIQPQGSQDPMHPDLIGPSVEALDNKVLVYRFDDRETTNSIGIVVGSKGYVIRMVLNQEEN